MTTPIKFSVMTGTHALGKATWWRDGRVAKDKAVAMGSGHCRVHSVVGLKGVADVLASLKPENAAVWGIPHRITADGENVTVRSNDVLEAAEAKGTPLDAIGRRRVDFKWNDGAGVFMIDVDIDGDDQHTHESIMDDLVAIEPSFATCERLEWYSSSSFIFKDDKQVVGSRGLRIYFIIADAGDTLRASQALFNRLWLAGRGHIAVGSSGSNHVRSIIDGSVYKPEGLDYVCGADCHDGLEQRRPAIEWFDGGVFDSSALRDLDAIEQARLKSLIAAAKADPAIVLRTAETKAAYKAKKSAEIAAASPQLNEVEVERVISLALTPRGKYAGVLCGSWVLTVRIKSVITEITVREILRDKVRWHGAEVLDPIEPDAGRNCSVIYTNQHQPALHTFRRGGEVYGLQSHDAVIVLSADETETVDALMDFYSEVGGLYHFGDSVATVGDDGFKNHKLGCGGLRYQIQKVIKLFKWSGGRKPELKQCNLPDSILSMFQDVATGNGGRAGLPKLMGVSGVPLFFKDGRIRHGAGYDAASKLYLKIPFEVRVPEKPTDAECGDALARLWMPFKEFDYASADDKSAMLCALLLACIRPNLSTAPAVLINAANSSSGKTKLCSCLSVLAQGSPAAVSGFTTAKSHQERDLATVLRPSPSVIFFDNIERGTEIGGAALERCLTSAVFQSRVLGKSESFAVPNRGLMVFTGNGLRASTDMVRRLLRVNIEGETEKKVTATYALEPVEYCTENRAAMVADALTILRFGAQSDAADGAYNSSFPDYAATVQKSLWAVNTLVDVGAWPDPFKNIAEDLAGSAENEDKTRLFDAIWEAMGEVGLCVFGATEILKETERNSVLADAFKSLPNMGGRELTSNSISRALNGFVGTKSTDYELGLEMRKGTKFFWIRSLHTATTK